MTITSVARFDEVRYLKDHVYHSATIGSLAVLIFFCTIFNLFFFACPGGIRNTCCLFLVSYMQCNAHTWLRA